MYHWQKIISLENWPAFCTAFFFLGGGVKPFLVQACCCQKPRNYFNRLAKADKMPNC
jgi:hypothetical protein